MRPDPQDAIGPAQPVPTYVPPAPEPFRCARACACCCRCPFAPPPEPWYYHPPFATWRIPSPPVVTC